jgi:type IV secretory pathway VirJ component
MTIRPKFARAVAFFTAVFVTVVILAAGTPAAKGLPVVECPSNLRSDTLAILVTGDGGWRALDRGIAEALNSRGVSVVGLISPEFFAERKTANESARALTTLIDSYTKRWHRGRVILIGYSRGAGVLPFMVSRLSAADRSRVSVVALLGLDAGIDFHYTPKVLLWRADDDLSVPVRPELEKIRDRHVVCVAGSDDKDAMCRSLTAQTADVFLVPGGHHFGGDYKRIAARILEEARLTATL